MPTAITLDSSLTKEGLPAIRAAAEWQCKKASCKKAHTATFLKNRLGITPEPYLGKYGALFHERCGQQSQGYRQLTGGTYQPHLEKGTNSIMQLVR